MSKGSRRRPAAMPIDDAWARTFGTARRDETLADALFAVEMERQGVVEREWMAKQVREGG